MAPTLVFAAYSEYVVIRGGIVRCGRFGIGKRKLEGFMVTLKIWHGVRHDDFDVTEVSGGVVTRDDALTIIAKIFEKGFFVHNEDNVSGIIPWHRINYFEIEKVM